MCKISARSNHEHDCVNKVWGCKGKVKCSDAYLERNYDGYPEVICTLNINNGEECEECALDTPCDYCLYPSHLGHEEDCIFWDRVAPTEAPIESYLNGEEELVEEEVK